MIAGFSLTIVEVLLLCAGLFIAGFSVPARAAPEVAEDPARGGRGIVLAAGALAAAMLVLLAVDLTYQPLFRTDAWTQWTPKARAIVLLGGLDPRVFASPAYQSMNLDYPLLVPSVEAIDFRFMGFDTQVLHLQFWLLLAGFVAALAELLAARVGRLLAWPMITAVAVAPTVGIETASAYADVPLAIFFALAGVCAWRWLRDGELPSLCLLAIFSAAALATKVEGAVLVAALYVTLIALLARSSRRRAGLTLLAALVSLVGIVPWRVWTTTHDVPVVFKLGNAFSPGFLASHVDRLPTVLGSLAREMLDPTSWLLLLPVAVAAAVIAARFAPQKEGVVLALGTFALACAGLVWVYWSTPFSLGWHLAVSSQRVTVGPVLFFASLSPLLLGDALGARASPASASATAAVPRRREKMARRGAC